MLTKSKENPRRNKIALDKAAQLLSLLQQLRNLLLSILHTLAHGAKLLCYAEAAW